MPSFSLTLEIDEASLRTILEVGEKVVLVKAPADGDSQVAWAVFQPFENNQVVWASDYALYARRDGGVVIAMTTTEYPTPSGVAYKFSAGGVLTLTDAKDYPPEGTYRLFNESGDSGASDLRFGLVQRLSANGEKAENRINAQIVPNQQLADFTPEETVIVWLQSNVSVGDTLRIPPAVGASLAAPTSTVMSRSTEVRFGGAVASAVYKYDPSVGGFVPGGQG